MPMKIGTWNLCLGLFHKKDIVREILQENNLDLLTLQEIELKPDIELNNLGIKGYTFEAENNDFKRRIGIYIRNNITYKRRLDLEKPNLHTIIIDIGSKEVTRIISVYRTFKPQDMSTPRENFKKQLQLINSVTTNSTILLGDMNLDERKRHRIDYCQRQLFEDFEEILGHHQFTQHVREHTWERVVLNQVKNSIIDHIYSTDSTMVSGISYKNTSIGDHRLIILTTLNTFEEENLELWRRNWKNYSKRRLLELLVSVNWDTEITTIQDMWNAYEQNICTVVENITPIVLITRTKVKKTHKLPEMRKIENRRNYLLRKRKRNTQSEDEKAEIVEINKKIRNHYYRERRENVRRKIIPGNTKSLWDAIKIARDIEPTFLPEEVYKNDVKYARNEMPAAFCEHFAEKIRSLESELKINKNVYNGCKLIEAEERNFMTKEAVAECLKELKTKNCEGFDRIPLRILKDGAEILCKPLSVLFEKIYNSKQIPVQWKVAKIIPLHKKGSKMNIENYRPISNLCSVSKIFEKLILKRLEEIGEENGINLTGEQQHGFKKNRSTITAGLTLQSILANALDEDEYAVMSSLDLSAAFDLVNHELLLTRLSKMGIPNDVIKLLESWLKNRYCYVEANGKNSIITTTEIGTIQGSILGPILYALFLRPLYDKEKLTTFADDNYVIERHREKRTALERLGIRLKRIIKWLRDSGLKVNEAKTELCIFHRVKNTEGLLKIDTAVVNAKDEINVLGLTFDSRLNWTSQVSRSIKNANTSLQAIKMIRKYFSRQEVITLLTSNFYSKLYYGSEIWQIPKLNQISKKQLLRASANALKLCEKTYDPNISFVELHKKYDRALPNDFNLYKHCLLLFKVFNFKVPKNDWIDLNFQMLNSSRQKFFDVQSRARFRVGNNILCNRLSCLNRKLDVNLLNLSNESYKIACKKMFLT